MPRNYRPFKPTTDKLKSRTCFYQTREHTEFTYFTCPHFNNRLKPTILHPERLTRYLGIHKVRNTFRKDLLWLMRNNRNRAVIDSISDITLKDTHDPRDNPARQLYNALKGALNQPGFPDAYVPPKYQEVGEYLPKNNPTKYRKEIPTLYSAPNPTRYSATAWELHRIRRHSAEINHITRLETFTLHFIEQGFPYPWPVPYIYESAAIVPYTDFPFLSCDPEPTDLKSKALLNSPALLRREIDKAHAYPTFDLFEEKPARGRTEPPLPILLPARENPVPALSDVQNLTLFTQRVNIHGVALVNTPPPELSTSIPILGGVVQLYSTDANLCPVYTAGQRLHIQYISDQQEIESLLIHICVTNSYPMYYLPWNGIEDEFGKIRNRTRAPLLFPIALTRLLFRPTELTKKNFTALPWGMLNALCHKELQPLFLSSLKSHSVHHIINDLSIASLEKMADSICLFSEWDSLL